ncbi:hypothetical protein DYBT9275_04792 [Dyadobacter sp. CECT 9275]|uniref:Glycoside hydrolase family 65 central catalytic domain-containing protein n=1 Tax=Dyadobacter helix TaxID=2822344 RepID=A0A916JGM3_9BACT|nr:DUF5703 domain-containing protein [Dyadobacter sp. CECT 9275]CAG5010682.1 hypothetical protein DYBT9275_04792 [Dyadobacter sp. CECT 9275]
MLKLTGLTFAAGVFPLRGFGSFKNAVRQTDWRTMQKSAFDPERFSWAISWPGQVSRYDLIYYSPPMDAMQGIPLGNGDVGVLFWCEESKIIAAVNKSDLWDDAPFTEFHNWDKKEEDYNTTLRHACRIVIDFKLPIFSTLYLTDFQARLSISDGVLTMGSSSPFGKVTFKAFVDFNTGLLSYDLKTEFTEALAVEVGVERFGSRTFSHWYSQINRDASIGTAGTNATVDDAGIYIHQKLATADFTVAGKVLTGSAVYRREHSRRATIVLPSQAKTETGLVFLVSDATNESNLEMAKKSLDKVQSVNAFQDANREAWRTIWTRSLMDYGDDYLTNLWYLTMFYSIASQRGKYPGRFNNGIWAWSRDVQNWNHYFHWNQQQIYWPLNAAGHHDLVEPYLNFRFDSLQHARDYARKHFKIDGAFVSDVTDRRGYNSSGEQENHTPIAEIALDFWRQYRFTGDKQFLKEKALPYMLDASRFFVTIFVKESDGLYHAREGTGYEGWIKLKDGLTELTYVKALIQATLDALKIAGKTIPEATTWKELILNLAPMPLVPAGDQSVASEQGKFKLLRGNNKNMTVATDQIVAAGWGIKEKKWLTVYHPADDAKFQDFNLLDGIFPTVASAPVFPSGLIGLSTKKQNPALFESLKTTALLYPQGVTGWDTQPIVLARLGLSEAVAATLARYPERWQIYCNGWGHWGMENEIVKDAEWFFRTNQVSDVSDPGKKFPFPMWPFRHMSMEGMAVFATTLNECLLQSHEDIIRIAPAFAGDRSARFMLHAVGGFKVSAQINSGTVQWVCIKSLSGNPCRLQLPWPSADLYIGKKSYMHKVEDGIALFDTKINDVFTIVPKGVPIADIFYGNETAVPNETARLHASGKAKIGLPRMF